MGNFKSRFLVLIGILLFIGVTIGIFYYLESYEGIYYTKIDNTKITELNRTSNMKYEYTLNSYNKNGKLKKIKFKTVRELKDQAYLKLIVKATGVNKWEEVKYEDLPAKVQKILNK